ncbi:MAG: glycoside hydrolase family 92 protein [Bacteroidales bacterium]|jgi:putative alpha-1,2-mannosidase|nr:glycoside hydrolase family 92 protein [Bacteroidales bacterium]
MKRTIYIPILLVVLFCVLQPVDAKRQNSDFVNLFIGTSGDNGQVDPGAGVPFGMIRVCPDTEPRQHAGYDYRMTKVSGISINRLSGVGCGGAGGNISIKPSAADFELHINKASELAMPGYYTTTFNSEVKAELTATKNVAVERYSFLNAKDALLTIDFGACFERMIEEEHHIISDHQIEGSIVGANVCGRGRYKLFFYMDIDQNFSVEEQETHNATFRFDDDTKELEVRIAVSSVSADEARSEYALSSELDFSTIKENAISLWNEKLNKIDVEGSTLNQRTIFYTSLYRCYLSPVDVTSSSGYYLGSDGDIHPSYGVPYFSSWSIWDTYRTKFPLLVLLEPTAMSHISQSLVRLYQTGKKNWSTEAEATPTVRTEHTMILLLDAYRKGIKGIDFNVCYAQMCDEAARLPLNSPDQKLEAVGDLWALSQISAIINKPEKALYYRKKADALFEATWSQDFRTIDDSYAQMRDNGLYQGTRWQYRWAVPYYLDRMIEMVGGQDVLLSELRYYFDNHLHNHGNEPDIHVPYLYNRLGASHRTYKCVNDIMDQKILHKYGGNAELPTPYFGCAYKNNPVGYSPEMDEDDGTMSAWYVFGAIGIYPLMVGEAYYEILPPLFERVQIHLENGETFSIDNHTDRNFNHPIKGVQLNGKAYLENQVSQEQLLQGGALHFY